MIEWGEPRHKTPTSSTEQGTQQADSEKQHTGVTEMPDHAVWQGRSRVLLRPIAAPNILALFGYAGASIMVGSWQAGWYGTPLTPTRLFPFVVAFGGLAQFLAGLWGYRARDALATAMHSMWGAFWMAWGLMFMLVAVDAFPVAVTPRIGALDPGFGFWFVVLALITVTGSIAALGENLALTAALTVRFAGAAFTAGGFLAPATWCLRVGGWLFVVSAVIAAYVAAALMLQDSFGRTILPLFEHQAAKNIPGRKGVRPLEYPYGQPGVRKGQ